MEIYFITTYETFLPSAPLLQSWDWVKGRQNLHLQYLFRLCRCFGGLWYLDNADGLPGKVEAGVEQEGEDQGEGLVPAQTETDSRVQRWAQTHQARRLGAASSSAHLPTHLLRENEGLSKVTAHRSSRTSGTALFSLRLSHDHSPASQPTEGKHKRYWNNL